jgi:hypothetical protein
MTSFKFKSAIAGLALALSAAALTPANAFNYLNFQRIAQHDYWASFSVKVDGAPGTGAVTTMKDGSSIAVLFVKKHAFFITDDDNWRLAPNTPISVHLVLDGVPFEASGLALSSKEVGVGAEDQSFIKRLTTANEAVVEVNGRRWTLHLKGLNASLSEALDEIKKIEASY